MLKTRIRNHRLAIGVVLCLGVAGLIVFWLAKASATSNRSLSIATKSTVPIVVPRNSSLAADQIDDVRGLAIAIKPRGFEPAAVELPAGRYYLIVQNRCGIRDLTFRLERENGEKLHEVNDKKLQWKKEFDLHPGTYILSIVEHPAWRSLITIRPQ